MTIQFKPDVRGQTFAHWQGSDLFPQPASPGIPCFTEGTWIAAERGATLIEDLQVGDRVFTRDHGLRPVRWIGRRTIRAIDQFAPVLIRPGVFIGMSAPLIVSQNHRVLFSGYRAQLLFGESEVLVSARHLIDGAAVDLQMGGTVTYVHLLFDSHEIIYANGIPTESFHPGDAVLKSVGQKIRAELFVLFPELRTGMSALGTPARRCLSGTEAEMLQM